MAAEEYPIELHNAEYRIKQHLFEYFTSPAHFDVCDSEASGKKVIFTVKVFTQAIPNSQINNEVYNIRSTILSEQKDAYTMKLMISADYDDLIQ